MTAQVALAGAADSPADPFPGDLADDCPEFGQLPTYTSSGDDQWSVHCDGADGATSSIGIPGSFIALFVLVLLAGIGISIWRVSTARRMARSSGMNVGDATAMALMDDNGLSATYLASNLRHAPASVADPTPHRTTAERLEELQQLLAQGLVTQAEHDERRRRILDEL